MGLMQPSPATQFANLAEAYSKSKGHANPEVLAMLVALIEPNPADRLLDVATGPGHVALAFAPHVASVVAQDLTPSMLEFVEAESVRRGLSNVSTLLGSAESLAKEDASFDIVTTRLGAHHFPDVPAALREFFRVLRPGGKLMVYDTTVPEDAELDAEINRIEILRDPSHVRNYRASEWRSMIESTGFAVSHEDVAWFGNGEEMEIESWMERIRTPQENRPLVRAAFEQASPALQSALRIVDGKRFQLQRVLIVARK
jgi:ubiquinone/menaquinone biosynthesis C-methylase UbiE